MFRGKKFSLAAVFLVLLTVFFETRAQDDTLIGDSPKIETSEKIDTSKENSKLILPSTDPDSLIHPGDLIEVDVVGSTEFDWRGTVTPEGFLGGFSFTKVPIHAACKDEASVGNKIVSEYKSFLNDPKVIVSILDRSNRPLARLFGAINSPQRFKLKRQVFLNELLIIAGGFTEKARGEIQILRSGGASCAGTFDVLGNNIDPETQSDKPAEGAFVKVRDSSGATIITLKISDILKGIAEANPRIYYGDIITVLEAEPVYVTGAVENPSKLDLRSELTVSRAIASSGGPAKGADQKNITLFRRNGSGTEAIEIDLVEIEAGRNDDLVLKPFDIIDVPGKGGRGAKYPPVIQDDHLNSTKIEPPLRIID